MLHAASCWLFLLIYITLSDLIGRLFNRTDQLIQNAAAKYFQFQKDLSANITNFVEVSFWVCISCIFLFSNFERHYAMHGYDTDTILLLKTGSLYPVQLQGSMNATVYSSSTRSIVSAASIGVTWPITVGGGAQNRSWVLGTHLTPFCVP